MTKTVDKPLRTCRDCGLKAHTEADLEGFTAAKAACYGRENRCKPCTAARTRRYAEKNREAIRERQQEATAARAAERRAAAPPKPLRACSRCGLEAWDSDGLSQFTKDKNNSTGYRNLCRECNSANTTKWCAENKGHRKNYREATPARQSVNRANQRAREYGLTDRLDLDEVITAFGPTPWTCTYCLAPCTGLDHFEAFARGGRNTLWNVTPCCPSCNYRKREFVRNGLLRYPNGFAEMVNVLKPDVDT